MLAHKRLQREIIALQKESPQFIRARPLESDILTFFYVIEGPPDSPYAGGHYLGKLCFPAQVGTCTNSDTGRKLLYASSISYEKALGVFPSRCGRFCSTPSPRPLLR